MSLVPSLSLVSLSFFVAYHACHQPLHSPRHPTYPFLSLGTPCLQNRASKESRSSVLRAVSYPAVCQSQSVPIPTGLRIQPV